MRRGFVALFLLALSAQHAGAQVFDLVNLAHLNRKLSGRVVDHTHNHGADRRLYSPILGRPRDLYVYLPPGYRETVAYPLVVFLHGADVDEHDFLDPSDLRRIDQMITRGDLPAVIIAAPDGTYEGENLIRSTHSLWVNGAGGRFEDHVVAEVLPFVAQTYSVRPERRAHVILGVSAGSYGAMAIAIKHRDIFGAVATIGGALNLRYNDRQGGYRVDFDPCTYSPRTAYNPHMLIGTFYFGLVRKQVGEYLAPVYGADADMIAKVARDNPADLLFSTGLRPGELEMYVNFPRRDNFNFDAQDESFAWLAATRDIAVDLVCVPRARHNLSYIEAAEPSAYLWLGRHMLGPVDVASEYGQRIPPSATVQRPTPQSANWPPPGVSIPLQGATR